VRLDVWPGVFAYGILLVPRNIPTGQRLPVVVCQHGLEGRPQEVADPRSDSHYYHRFAAKLAEEGFVTFLRRTLISAKTAFGSYSVKPTL
jgi:hypothetical protein